jgi:hypothetical protein
MRGDLAVGVAGGAQEQRRALIGAQAAETVASPLSLQGQLLRARYR